MKNVLIFPCGSEIGLEIYRSLSSSKFFNLFGGNSVDDHGKFVYQNYISNIPFINNEKFIDSINEIIKKYNIDFIIPAHDSVVLKLAQNEKYLLSPIITSCLNTCIICRSKMKTYEKFDGIIQVPKIYKKNQYSQFPIFLKPDVGQGSKGTQKVNKYEDVEFYLKKDNSLLILEYLPGKEYTIDCFTNRKGELMFAEGRERCRISNGISVNSKFIQNKNFQKIANIINKTLSFQGAWFFQVKERFDGELVLMEIAPRIAGTMELFRVMGVNFIELSLFDKMNIDVNIIFNKIEIEIDRSLKSKFIINNYYSTVYIDLDDTIIKDEKVNINIMKFIYDLKNKNKKIILLSKHKGNIEQTLNKFAISKLLFDEIIILNEIEEKCNYITENSIFIDDSFKERKNVYDKFKIPVFSVDAIETIESI